MCAKNYHSCHLSDVISAFCSGIHDLYYEYKRNDVESSPHNCKEVNSLSVFRNMLLEVNLFTITFLLGGAFYYNPFLSFGRRISDTMRRPIVRRLVLNHVFCIVVQTLYFTHIYTVTDF